MGSEFFIVKNYQQERKVLNESFNKILVKIQK